MFTSIFVVGLGNIGSQVVPLLACMPGLQQVGLVDFDRYDTGNLGSQRLKTDEGIEVWPLQVFLEQLSAGRLWP